LRQIVLVTFALIILTVNRWRCKLRQDYVLFETDRVATTQTYGTDWIRGMFGSIQFWISCVRIPCRRLKLQFKRMQCYLSVHLKPGLWQRGDTQTWTEYWRCGV